MAHDTLAAAFVAAQQSLADVAKGRRANAGQYAYAYADLSDVLGQVRPVLAAHGLAITQSVSTAIDEVLVTTTLLHTSGQTLVVGPLAMPLGKTAQQTGSSITYARRYAIMALLGLAAADEDDDGAQAAPRSTEGQRIGKSDVPSVRAPQAGESRPVASPDKPASDKQRNYAKALMRSTLPDWSPPEVWSAAEASELIEELKAEAAANAG